MSDSGNTAEASRSPATPQCSPRPLPNERTRELQHRLFGSDDESGDEYVCSSPQSARAPSHERLDDGATHRHTDNCGTNKGTTVKRDELKPWRLPERLIDSLSHETSQHHRIPLFDAAELHGLDPSAGTFCAEEYLISMSSSDIDGTTVIKSVIKTRFWQRGTPSSKMSKNWTRRVA